MKNIDEELAEAFRGRFPSMTHSASSTLAGIAVDVIADRLGIKPWELDKKTMELAKAASE